MVYAARYEKEHVISVPLAMSPPFGYDLFEAPSAPDPGPSTPKIYALAAPSCCCNPRKHHL